MTEISIPEITESRHDHAMLVESVINRPKNHILFRDQCGKSSNAVGRGNNTNKINVACVSSAHLETLNGSFHGPACCKHRICYNDRIVRRYLRQIFIIPIWLKRLFIPLHTKHADRYIRKHLRRGTKKRE